MIVVLPLTYLELTGEQEDMFLLKKVKDMPEIVTRKTFILLIEMFT